MLIVDLLHIAVQSYVYFHIFLCLHIILARYPDDAGGILCITGCVIIPIKPPLREIPNPPWEEHLFLVSLYSCTRHPVSICSLYVYPFSIFLDHSKGNLTFLFETSVFPIGFLGGINFWAQFFTILGNI